MNRITLLTLIAAGLFTACIPLNGLLDAAKFGNGQPEMVAFNSCGEVEQFIKAYSISKASFIQSAFKTGGSYNGFSYVNSLSGSGGSSSGVSASSPPEAQAVPFDQTNLQEAGVDEADIFKVDSTHAFALHGSQLMIISAAAADGAENKVAGKLALDGQPIEMFLSGDRVVVITRTNHGTVDTEMKGLGLSPEAAPTRPATLQMLSAIVIDVADRENPKVLRKVAVEGTHIASRRIDNQLYLVTRSSLTSPSNQTSGITSDFAWLFNQKNALQNTPLDAWLPYHYDLNFSDSDGASAAANRVDCASTYGSYGSGGDQSLSVYSLDFTDDKSQVKTSTILGDGATVYASEKSILVALTNYNDVAFDDDDTTSGEDAASDFDFGDDFSIGFGSSDDDSTTTSFDSAPERPKTFIHRFELAAEGAVNYQATGVVDGWILNQFSLSEYKGYVRVATTEADSNRSMVFILQPTAKSSSEMVSLANFKEGPKDKLGIVGSLRDIAVGEKLYATRFVANKCYLVTFRQTDPLWVIDVSNPTKPTIKGELVIPGYSTYLHPIADQKLLAVGRDTWGVKISLFDVKDDTNPDVIEEIVEGGSNSDSEAITEHRAFRYIDDKQLLMLPIADDSNRGLFVYGVDLNSGFSSRGMINHAAMLDPNTGADHVVRRAYRIGDNVYSYSAVGVSITSLATLEDVAQIDLPDLP